MDIASILRHQQAYFLSGATRGLEERGRALRSLATGLDRHEAALLEALHADLGKNGFAAYTSEFQGVLDEIAHALRHLKSWLRPQRRKVPFIALPGRAEVYREPCGSVLIIGPWNYPLHLLLTPLVNALAAGCTAVLKPSEFTPRVSAATAALISDVFPKEHVTVVEGGRETAEACLSGKFDHIFFTGSVGTGKKVMAAAAETLTPVTLELGGKCPALVFAGDTGLSTSQLDVIARRIAWGKHLNAGQTCVAPDHVLVEETLHGPLMDALGRAFQRFGTAEYGRMVNHEHFQRVRAFLDQGRVVHGGSSDEGTLKIEPTVLTDIPSGAAVMEEEIFGPVLPVIPCPTLEEALAQVRSRAPALAVYAFTLDGKVQQLIAAETVSGGVCINDVVLQITGPDLPFGGVGESGMGRYRGKAGFDTFTRERVVLKRSLWPDFPFRYPPVKISLQGFKRVAKFFGKT